MLQLRRGYWMGQASNAVFDRKSAMLHCRLQCVEVLRCFVRVAYGPVGDGQVELVGTSLASVDRAARALGVCRGQHRGTQTSVVLELRRRPRRNASAIRRAGTRSSASSR
jgi:hypothetical protein